MHSLNIRGIDDNIYAKIKNKSKNKGMSINKYLLNLLSGILNHKKPVEYHDLDDLFGTWTEENYNDVMQATAESRVIDKEIWD